ncbi:transcription factor ces-2-like [Danaus plexippus]|uniref:transcription factor ces-2-like n=1 Tax=Danaus plexippus TaxID=13037 RepID=UPI002AB3121F|nr:transcription factor ces-2-like [Danaus plexippus]
MENMYGFDSSCSPHSALTALRLLRSYNHFVVPPEARGMVPLLTALPPPCLPAYCHHLPLSSPPFGNESTNSVSSLPEDGRRRGEKRPIPSELKDEKYFERRRRNNQAAKKSRDARRMREDQIAWRACVLEQENASLRAHVAALTQETRALRALLARDEAPTSTTD